MQRDISASLSILQNYYRKILEATQLTNMELVEKHDGASTQWNIMQMRNEDSFCVLYYTSSRKKRQGKHQYIIC